LYDELGVLGIGAFGIALLVVIAKIGFGEYQLALFHHKSISITP
jgi:hypothetical protein